MSLRGLNYETFFRDADVNNDGHLSLQELISTLRKYGYKKSDDEIKVSSVSEEVLNRIVTSRSSKCLVV